MLLMLVMLSNRASFTNWSGRDVFIAIGRNLPPPDGGRAKAAAGIAAGQRRLCYCSRAKAAEAWTHGGQNTHRNGWWD
jgi:hypothetical protein